ncbi:glycosyl transferase [Chitinophaga lutea]|uniref:Glycosyl transferase n=1 Tax=Chitinophaga lutea TaxID=2488634 RepID=A0A3N4PWJ9_9BACT|nr:glycosyl transferase [Chitinophaga lutea]RPE12268.1 glycosyl transferase [Chitinophaga lutea]
MDFDHIVLPTYVINLKERTDRYKHTMAQFRGKTEFDLRVLEACTGENGRMALWNSILRVVKMAVENDDDVIVLCEDDHTFTSFYNKTYLFENIIEANEQGAELLNGGVGGFNHAVPLTANRYWMDSFYCTQFLILYKPIFPKILHAVFESTDTADGMFSVITSHKMMLYPFVSVQTDFGYSDVTENNNRERELIESYFTKTADRLRKYKDVYDRYLKV